MVRGTRTQRGTSVPPKTTGVRSKWSSPESAATTSKYSPPTTVAPSRDKRPEKDVAANAQNERQMIGEQITETQELRQSILKLGISTKSALSKAEAASKKRAAGGSKAVIDAIRHLNKEVGVLRTSIEALLKDLEAGVMHLANGTSPPGSFDFETTKSALADFKVCFAELQAIHNNPVPVKRGRGKNANIGKDETPIAYIENAEVFDGGSIGQSATEAEREATQGEVLEERELVTKSKTTAAHKQKPQIAPKGGRKRARDSGDDKPHLEKKSKKAKPVNNESDDSMSSILTPFDNSDDSDGGDEGNMDFAPPPNNHAVASHETVIPQPAPGVLSNNITVATAMVPAQEPIVNEGDKAMSGTPVEGQVLEGFAVTRVVSNPVQGHGCKPILSGSPAETTTEDDTNSAVDIDNMAGDMAEGTAGDPAGDMIGNVADNTAGEVADDIAGSVAGGAGDHAVTDMADEVVGETDDEVVGETDNEIIDDMDGDEADEECDTIEQEQDLEDDRSQMSDSATMESEGSAEDSVAPVHGGASGVSDNGMRLAAASDADDLRKHVIAQKALVKKEGPVETGRVPKVKKETKAPKRDSLRAKWDAMSLEEQKEKQDAATKSIRAFLRDPVRNSIPVHIRAMIREVAEFCIPACQITRKLALHVLENKYHNTFCIYHQTIDKTGVVNDLTEEGAFRVTGTPFARLANEKPSKDHPAQAPVECEPGYLNCGCSEDEALLDFYWWKMAEATSPTTNATEGWLNHRKMDPRTRTLMFNFFADWTNFEVNDIYVGYPVDNSLNARMARYDTKITRIHEAKDEERREEVRRLRKEEAQRIRELEEAAARKKQKGIKRRVAI